jgi:hypothetical protein
MNLTSPWTKHKWICKGSTHGLKNQIKANKNMRDQNIHRCNYNEGAKFEVLSKECISNIFVLV